MLPPLAARLRPKSLAEFIGQSHLVGKGTPLRSSIEQGRLHSMILWGPPGSGKTSLAHLIAQSCQAQFIALSAVLAGVKDIRAAVEAAQASQKEHQSTILFIDEIHRFNKAQQDALLPFVEDGTVCLIGATTENPSFEVINALLSRCRVYVLKSLGADDLKQLIWQALHSEAGGLNKYQWDFAPPGLERLITSADGDARRLLNILDILVEEVLAHYPDPAEPKKISAQLIEQVLQQDYRRFDKQGELFYEQISALHKAVRGSSPDAALYWLIRMLDGGCDPTYIARRIVRMASEDIGNADPRGLDLAMAAWGALERLGSPEGELALAQAVTYLACAPKSNAVYKAFNTVKADIERLPSYSVPVHLRNAPTGMMKKMGYGKQYRYDHDEPDAFARGQTYFPPEMGEKRYYFPTERGLELKIAEKLRKLRGEDSSIVADLSKK